MITWKSGGQVFMAGIKLIKFVPVVTLQEHIHYLIVINFIFKK